MESFAFILWINFRFSFLSLSLSLSISPGFQFIVTQTLYSSKLNIMFHSVNFLFVCLVCSSDNVDWTLCVHQKICYLMQVFYWKLVTEAFIVVARMFDCLKLKVVTSDWHECISKRLCSHCSSSETSPL